jgi:hypothetical protein
VVRDNDVLDLARLGSSLPEMRDRYRDATPFPHVVIDDFLDGCAALAIEQEFEIVAHDRWLNYAHVNERKFAHVDPTVWGPTAQRAFEALVSDEFVAYLGELTGIDGLFADRSLEGGGLHISRRGGYLNVHADFTVHPQHREWHRRVNVLVYFNHDWDESYGGDLELWDHQVERCGQRIGPIGNRAVIFTTDASSFHGHPEPLRCPPGTTRKSMAFYYFTLDENAVVRSTEYRARPGESRTRAALIYMDKQAIRTYDWLKRRLHITDDTASRILERIQRLLRHDPHA